MLILHASWAEGQLQLSREAGGWVGPPAGSDVAGVAEEGQRVRQPEERAKGQPHDAVGLAQLVLPQRAH